MQRINRRRGVLAALVILFAAAAGYALLRAQSPETSAREYLTGWKTADGVEMHRLAAVESE